LIVILRAVRNAAYYAIPTMEFLASNRNHARVDNDIQSLPIARLPEARHETGFHR
jgi:hypothetical protein